MRNIVIQTSAELTLKELSNSTKDNKRLGTQQSA